MTTALGVYTTVALAFTRKMRCVSLFMKVSMCFYVHVSVIMSPIDSK